MIVGGGILRGAGGTRATLVISAASTWGLRVGLGYVFGIAWGLGLSGIWLGWCADFWVRALLVALRFRRGKWKTLRV